MELRLRQFAGRFTRIAAFVFIACALLLCAAALMPTQKAYAVTDGWNEEGTCEWRVDSQGCLTIRPIDDGEIGDLGSKYTWADYPWHDERIYIEKVSIPKPIIAGESADRLFAELEYLESIEGFQNIDFSQTKSAGDLFGGCSSLKEVSLDGIDTSTITDMRYMFSGCSSLTSLDISNFDMSNVKYVTGMFSNCSSLKSLNLAGINTSNVEDMSSFFAGCSSLENLDVSMLDTSNVVGMSEMFRGCSSLKSLDLSRFNTSNVVSMGGAIDSYQIDTRGMFSGCSSLTELDLGSFVTSNVEAMGGMFSGCNSLKDLNISSFETGKVSQFANMFDGCSSLERLDVSGFDTSAALDMSAMFKGCSNLKELNIAKFDTDRVRSMMEMFSGCSSLNALDVTTLNTSKVTKMGAMFKDCKELDAIDVSGFDTSKLIDPEDTAGQEGALSSMFEGCSSLQEINLDELFTSNVVDFSQMFKNCSSLRSLDLSNFDTARAITMEEMFSGCSSLSQIELPNNFVGDSISYLYGNIDYLFYGCNSLETIPENFSFGSLSISSEDDIFVYTGDQSFLPTYYNGTDEAVLNYDWAGDNRRLILPTSEGWTQIGTCEWRIENGVLTIRPINDGETGVLPSMESYQWNSPWESEAQNITKIVIPKPISAGKSVSSLFANLTSLTEIEGLENLDVSNTAYFDNLFSGCSSLTSVDISSWDTSNAESQGAMFSECSKLSNVVIPDNFIGPKCSYMGYLFSGCSSLVTIPVNFHFGSNPDILKEGVFSNYSDGILETYYYGTDSNVINYDWAGDNRKLVTSQTSELAGTVAIAGDPCEGVTLKATATLEASCNDAQLRYQWFDASNDQQVSEVTDSVTFTIPEDSLGKSFYCVVTDASGKYTSSLKSNTVTANHAFGEWEVTKEATCTEAGSQVHTCEKCSYQETETIPAKGHSYSTDWTSDASGHWHACGVCGTKGDYAGHVLTEWTTTKEPTCTEPGEEKRSCPTCGYEETKEIAALNHEVGDEWNSDATHHWKDCIHCGESVIDDDHNYGDWTVTKQPTCTEDGEQKHSCQTCGWEETEVIPATSHTPSDEWSHNATDHWHVCQNCQAEVDKAAHTFGQWITVTEPGEFTPGEKVRTCEVCGYEERAEIPGTGHVSDRQWHFDGINHWNLCTDCGNQINVEAHDFGEWTVDIPAGCTTDGTEIRTCATCGYEQTQTIPATGHIYGEWIVTTEPTCTEEGVESRTCENCGNTETRAVDELGHNFSADWSSDANGHRHECTRCDAVADEAAHTFGDWQVKQAVGCTDGIEARYCTVCNYKETRTIPGAGHQPASEWSSDASGHWHACANCDDRLDLAEHTFGDWTVTADPTGETAGSKERTCEVCGYKDVVEIPTLTPGDPSTGEGGDVGESSEQGSSEQENGEEAAAEEADATPQTSDPLGVVASLMAGIVLISAATALVTRKKMLRR